MKLSLVLLVLFVCPVLSTAQSEKPDLRTLLQDSAYVFNRFDEVTAGLNTQIDNWNVPASTKMLFKHELSVVSQNVEAEKPTLNQLLLKSKVSSTELFDVYSEVTEVASELSDQSSNVANWGDEAEAVELAQLDEKATILAAKLGVVLRKRIEAQESQLESCTNKPSLPATKHK